MTAQGYIDPDYVDVAERIRLFYEKYPDGRLVTSKFAIQPVSERNYVACEALAYRTADDPHPARGCAWEPIPGPTPFTLNSELMNAETAAWGRAIVAVGIPSKKVASADEVQARQAPTEKETPATVNPVTKAQHGKIGALIKELQEREPEDSQADWVASSRGFVKAQFGKSSRKDLTTSEAGQLIDYLEAQLVPFG